MKAYKNAIFAGAMLGAAASLIFKNVNFKEIIRTAGKVYLKYQDETDKAVDQMEAKSRKTMNFFTNVGREASDILGK